MPAQTPTILALAWQTKKGRSPVLASPQGTPYKRNPLPRLDKDFYAI